MTIKHFQWFSLFAFFLVWGIMIGIVGYHGQGRTSDEQSNILVEMRDRSRIPTYAEDCNEGEAHDELSRPDIDI
ncbi:MAG: hypothetical protein AAF587_10380 [Bacteroidota bacterium]